MSDPIATLLRGLDRLERQLLTVAIPRGLAAAADHATGALQSSDAYAGQSGATRASSIAYAVTPDDDGSAASSQAYAAAAEHLSGFVGHAGMPQSEAVAGPEYGVVITVMTNYIDILENREAGKEAVIGPVITNEADAMTRLIAQGIQEALG